MLSAILVLTTRDSTPVRLHADALSADFVRTRLDLRQRLVLRRSYYSIRARAAIEVPTQQHTTQTLLAGKVPLQSRIV